MFENFTNKTVAAIMIAQQEARNLRQRFVGSEVGTCRIDGHRRGDCY